MSAQAIESEVVLCACGCGTEVNPLLREFRAAVAQGQTHRQVADEYGVSREYVSLLLRKPPRFAMGHHQQRKGNYQACANPNCHRVFNSFGPKHIYCTPASKANRMSDAPDPEPGTPAECAALNMAHKDALWREFDEATAERVARKIVGRDKRKIAEVERRIIARLERLDAVKDEEKAVKRVTVALPTWIVDAEARIAVPPRRLAYPAARSALGHALAEHHTVIRERLDALHSLVNSTIATRRRRISRVYDEPFGSEAWRAERQAAEARIIKAAMEANPELAELIEAQRKDERWGDRLPSWSAISLDAPLRSDTYTSRYDVVAGDDSSDPFTYLMAEAIRDEIGSLEYTDVRRLSDYDLRRLQDKLMDAGLVSISVTHDEREKTVVKRSAKHSRREPWTDVMAALGGPEPEEDIDDLAATMPRDTFGDAVYELTPPWRMNRMAREFTRSERRKKRQTRRGA